ncbi:hypothetical protein SAY87_031231 [Trapa incisa]|uniref:RING-type E3 ubiquitin transferase n=1 Tax=Trapa incisa TaxID=236973 RepID=A0AAN7KT10_9MYRT|nr:hypothetical protein SAY87_031231 [Trapa incisa]
MAAAAIPPPASVAVSFTSPAVIASIFCLFSLLRRSIGDSICGVSSCGGGGASFYPPQVRFPFRLRTSQTDPRCSYSPAFDLSCDGLGRTIIALPAAGNFTVDRIDYQSQTILLSDLDPCLPRRLLMNPSPLFTGPTFFPPFSRKFVLLNCSDEAAGTTMFPRSLIVPCLSEENYTVISVPSRWYDGSHGCAFLGAIIFPIPMPYWSNLDSTVLLAWSTPHCRSCEERGGVCGFDNGSEIACDGHNNSGLPSAAKVGIVFGVGIPGGLVLMGLSCFICRRIKTSRRGSSTDATTDVLALTAPRPMLLSMGLDGVTIESYPTTELGESKRLPKPSDNTCSICLCEYQPKETLRSIPECNHYFHMSCIDEWLRLNASCPLCRNSPETPRPLSLTSMNSNL